MTIVLLRAKAAALANADLKLGESALQLNDSESRFRLLAERSSEMIVSYGPDGTRLYVSPASYELLGYTPDEMVGRLALELVHPDDRDKVVALHRRMMAREI